MTLDEVISYNRLFADMETKSGDLEVAEYYRDTAKCLEELKELREQIAEYKRLLKAAVEDFAKLDRENAWNKNCMMPEMDCADCPLNRDSVDDRAEPCHSWRYAAEALALIGGGKDETK